MVRRSRNGHVVSTSNSKYTEDVRVLVQVNSVGTGHVNNVFFPNMITPISTILYTTNNVSDISAIRMCVNLIQNDTIMCHVLTVVF